MKTIIMTFVIALLTSQIVQAQGAVTYLSTLGQGSAVSNSIGSDSSLEIEFKPAAPIRGAFGQPSDDSGYILNSIQLEMADASGNPSGFTVSLYLQSDTAGASGVPPDFVSGLSGSTNPATAGIYTYTPDSSVTLMRSGDYVFLITAGTAVADGAYEWSETTSSLTSVGGWSSNDGVYSVNNNNFIGNNPGFAITATAVPEPSPSLLLLLGSGIFIYIRNRKK